MKQERYFKIIVAFFLLLSLPFLASAEAPEKLFPLPMAEVEKILSQWLFDSGFEIIRREKEGSRVQLRGMKGREMWELNLRSQSPLASWVRPHYVVDGQSSQERVSELWKFLEHYLKEEDNERMVLSEEAPPRVKARREAIACINVNKGGEELQFTGFVVDRRGLLLSTAHDLRGVQEVMISLSDGKVQKGSLIKIDFHRDLTLIDIRSRVHSSVPLSQVRNSLQNGEKVFAIGCPGQVRRFLSGTVDGPLRRVNNLPLWQMEMEIRPGSSGSPVFDQEGTLVGIVKGRYRGDASTGFVIPSSTILEFLREK